MSAAEAINVSGGETRVGGRELDIDEATSAGCPGRPKAVVVSAGALVPVLGQGRGRALTATPMPTAPTTRRRDNALLPFSSIDQSRALKTRRENDDGSI